MFTGLIEEIGTLHRVSQRGEALLLTIGASKVLEGVGLGDSISVNGVCLTVTSWDSRSFSVDVMPETYRHTNLKDLPAGSLVNLERAMAAGGRFGGHIVQGHVDGTGLITQRRVDANAVVFRIKPHDDALMRYVIPQGSITVDGISLTVTGTDGGGLDVSIIPHTLGQTVLQHKKAGDTVNLEGDILGKYVDHLLHYGSRSVSGPSAPRPAGGLSAAFLADNGFI
ncbi:riboflavin synthase subunit alpha [Paenibacillus sp. D9]|uniref:riboflavin synthase n=1 Tax=Paenibacillus sp. D9 TaxID=665792 RepID=UPI00061FF6C4|nr:riboflavin synthase [Paenibacillus sp. D9]KKC46216.1 riboflavin synthase subunit alpha [Paenibacillus sp. D9]